MPTPRPAGPKLATNLLAGLHVLLVEDDADARHVMATTLRYFGALVTVAPSAEEGLAILSHIVPDVLVTDLSLSGNDGLWLLERTRARHDARRLPAIAVTAHADLYRADSLMATGFDAVLAKPIELDALGSTIDELARRAH